VPELINASHVDLLIFAAATSVRYRQFAGLTVTKLMY